MLAGPELPHPALRRGKKTRIYEMSVFQKTDLQHVTTVTFLYVKSVCILDGVVMGVTLPHLSNIWWYNYTYVSKVHEAGLPTTFLIKK